MGAAGGVPSAPGGLRNTAGGLGQVSTFNPEWVSSGLQGGGGGGLPAFDFGNRPKFGEGQQAKLEEQKALAQKLKDAPIFRGTEVKGPSSDPEFQYYGDSMFGMLPEGYDPREKGRDWEGGEFNFEGIDKGWEDYEKEWQDRYSQDRFGPGSFNPNDPGWMADYGIANLYNMEQGMDLGYGDRKIVHSLSRQDPNTGMILMDPRDPYGYGADYGQWYNAAHGKGALEAQAKLFAQGYKDDDPAYAQYRQGYGEVDWNDMAQVEDLMRRMNMGGTKTANMQDMIAQNKRTDMTEAGIMMALSMGMGALAAPAGASMLGSQMTADALARSAIQGAYQYGG